MTRGRGRNLRHQLPAWSPLSLRALARASAGPFSAACVSTARTQITRDFRADEVLLTDSGRSALQVAIEIAAPTPSDVVALPAFQCFEVATAAVGAGRRIVLYDVVPDTLAPDLDSLRRALRAGASAVVVAPFYGVPVAWDPVSTLIEEAGAVAIEDAAQAHGAAWRDAPVGSLASVSVLSFGRGKGWTGGGGGALCVRRDRALLERARCAADRLGSARISNEARTLARAVAQWSVGRPRLYGIPARMPGLGLGETRYHEPAPPAAMAAVTAALIVATRAAAGLEAMMRRENAERWRRDLRGSAHLMLPGPPPAGIGGYIRLPALLRDDTRMAPENLRHAGLMRSYPATLYDLPALRPLITATGTRFPGSQALVRRLVTLPTHSHVTDRDRRAILDALASM